MGKLKKFKKLEKLKPYALLDMKLNTKHQGCWLYLGTEVEPLTSQEKQNNAKFMLFFRFNGFY